jgi:hypothetical protein
MRAFRDYVVKMKVPGGKVFDTLVEVRDYIEKQQFCVFLFAKADSEEKVIYDEAVNGLSGAMYAVATLPLAAETYEAKIPSIVMFKKYDDERVEFEGDMTNMFAIRTWIMANYEPWLKTESNSNVMGRMLSRETVLILWTKHAKDPTIELINSMIGPHLHSYVSTVVTMSI